MVVVIQYISHRMEIQCLTDSIEGFMTKEFKIYKFDYYKDKTKPDKKRIFTKKISNPDGCVVDSEGYLWSAQCNTGKVVRIDQNGNVVLIVDVDDENVASTLGGKDLMYCI